MKYTWVFVFVLVPVLTVHVHADPFATTVIDYTPAPGQFINFSDFNDVNRALGPPSGGGIGSADNTSLVSLGGFGGSITLGFDHTVVNDPRNPDGLDFIVFGNAFFVGMDPQIRFAECGHVEISLDANVNGQADDPWYLVPGSHITTAGQWETRTWQRTQSFPPHVQYPDETNYPGWPDSYTTGAYRLPSVFEATMISNPDPVNEFTWGYADHTPTLILGDMNGNDMTTDPEDDPGIAPEEFYTVPDDPYTVGITPGSGGGDAFDIDWAVNPTTWTPANLTGFDFIRISTAVDFYDVVTGELSTELDAVADVTAIPVPGDANNDGRVDGVDLSLWQSNYDPLGLNENTFAMGNWNDDNRIDGADLAIWQTNYDPLGPGSTSCQALPEPGTFMFVLIGGVGWWTARRRRHDG